MVMNRNISEISFGDLEHRHSKRPASHTNHLIPIIHPEICKVFTCNMFHKQLVFHDRVLTYITLGTHKQFIFVNAFQTNMLLQPSLSLWTILTRTSTYEDNVMTVVKLSQYVKNRLIHQVLFTA